MDKELEEKEMIAKAYNLLVELMQFNENIDDNVWCSAFLALYTDISRANGLSFHEYKEETIECMQHYKKLFEEG